MGVFDRYAPFVQDFIYAHQWENLRGIQVAAGEAIFDTDDNVLLCASTASGKTEAAFFPILTEFWEDPPHSVGALYIGPTKALINDQFYRLENLCEEAGINVWHWHGDVSSSHKAKLMKNPSGILQITPESLEAMLMRRHAAVAKLFCDLRYVVIDEVHALLRQDRGGQCLCLIERLARAAGVSPRRIGLSATIGDPEAVGAFLATGTGRSTVIPRVKEPPRTWRVSMEHFFMTGPQADEGAPLSAGNTVQADVLAVEVPNGLPGAGPVSPRAVSHEPDRPVARPCEQDCLSAEVVPGPPEAPTDLAPANADPGIGYIFEHTRGHKCLIFSNSREEAEEVCSTLRSYCDATGEPDRFLIHHGNLSAAIRESAEEQMRDDSSDLSIVATSTLELGVDVGRLERAFQIDAPFTVSSFLQRMGRTGRREAPPEMWFVMREEQPEARTLLPETIPWKLLQGIALVQLYREEHWVEPPNLDRLPYSLLCHQTLAILASEGELTPAQLASRVLTLTYFHRVSTDDFRELLRHLLRNDFIEQTEAGGLIVGLAGERVTSSYKFFAVFQENVEYTVRSDSTEIGTLCAPPPPGEKVAIAGRVWVVDEVDHERHLLYVTPVKGKVPAYFGEVAGDVNTHVLERMRRALAEHAAYPYLMPHARARLREARHVAEASHLTEGPLVCLGENDKEQTMWCLLPWLGTYAFLALERLLRIKCAEELGLKAFSSSRPYFITFVMKADEQAFLHVVKDAAERLEDPNDLLYPSEVPYFEKYDELVPESLVRKGFAEGVLDVAGMRERVAQW
ncbi:DEAD/DEAH box helicase [Olsenella profusa]|uniref:DEAD/DEAH box helicase n=1 Tax=Olsenella profusa TaxID=138595 RepID=A0ABS2F3M4_9ACTN|nr:DEAD/DEAH box helicase [Olsenella profusa]MBM6775550.1 DEAD/DEAH box helicase [Olsenella profusa]